MNSKFNKPNLAGFTLVDFLIGTAVILTLFIGSVMVLQTMTKGSTTQDNSRRVNQKLRSVAEQIRFRAGHDFQNMTTENEDFTGPFDRNIRVMSTVSGVDNTTRTRFVELTAFYMEGGKEKRKSMKFDVGQTRMQEAGSMVKLKVESETTGLPIEGVLFTAPTHGGTVAYAESGTDGVATLFAVAIAQSGIPVTVNGTPVRAYFDDTPPVFMKNFQTSTTRPGESENTHFDTPIKMKLPSRMEGIVTDVTTGNPIPNAEVRLSPYDTALPIELSHDEAYIRTDANGRYAFERLVPGWYNLRLIGNEEYSAPFRPSDGPWNLWALPNWEENPGYDAVKNIPAESTVRQDLQTIKAGSVKGKVYALGRNGSGASSVALAGPVTDGVYLKFYKKNEQVYKYPSGEMVNGDFTEYWHHDFANTEVHGEARRKVAITDSTGEYQINHFVARQVYKDHDYDQQYGMVDIRAHQASIHADLLPVLVMGPNTPLPWNISDIKLAVQKYNYLDWQCSNPPFSGTSFYPLNTDTSKFTMRIFTNHLNNSTDPDNQQDHTLHVLKTEALANVTGDIKLLDGNPYPIEGYVRMVRADNSMYGAFTHQANFNYAWDANKFPAVGNSSNIVFDPDFKRHSVFSSANTFSFSEYLPNPILPTVGGEKIRVKFEADNAQNLTTLFDADVVARKRVAWSYDESGFEDIPAEDIDVSEILLSARDEISNELIWQATVDIVDGKIHTSQTAHKKGTAGYSAEIQLGLGETLPVTVFVDPSQLPQYNNYRLRFESYSSDNRWAVDSLRMAWYEGILFTYNPTLGKFQGASPLPLMQIVEMGAIYGRVLDAVTGQPIIGVTVNLHVSGFGVLSVPTVEHTGPNGDYQYAFDHIKYVPYDNPDLVMTVNDPHYSLFDNWLTPSGDGHTEQRDIYLTPTPPSGGGNGGGPGGPGGL